MSTVRVAAAAFLVLCVVSVSSFAGTISFTENLAANPFASSGGNFSISGAAGLSPDTYGQFTWNGSTVGKYTGDPAGSLVAVYDSTKPPVRLERTLPVTVGMDRDFSFGSRMTIRSQGLVAPDTDYFEMTFALANHSLTGGNRAGSMTESANGYNQVEFAYFPNVAFWGGPTLQLNAFGSQLASPVLGAFDNFASPEFLDGDLGSNGAGLITSLPLNTPLDVMIDYEAATQLATLTVSRVNSDGSLTQLMLSGTGGITLDLSGAGYSSDPYGSNKFDPSHPFSLDSLIISSYYDSWAASPLSLYANVEFDQFTFSVQDSVPEPMTLVLVGTGVLVLVRRRRD